MAVRAAVYRHVLALTLRRELALRTPIQEVHFHSRRAWSSSAPAQQSDEPTDPELPWASSLSYALEPPQLPQIRTAGGPANHWGGSVRKRFRPTPLPPPEVAAAAATAATPAEAKAAAETSAQARARWRQRALEDRPDWQKAMESLPPRVESELYYPTVLGKRSRPTQVKRIFQTSTSDKPPWSQRDLPLDTVPTMEQLLCVPAAWGPNRTIKYINSIKRPRTVGAMHEHLSRLRLLIDRLEPATWSNISPYRQCVLLTLWSHWLDTASQLNDLGALPRMRGWEGREFAADRFDSLFLAIVGGKVPLKRPDSWATKWKGRIRVGKTSPEVEAKDEAEETEARVELEVLDPDPEREYETLRAPPQSEGCELHGDVSQPQPFEKPEKVRKGPVTHYTPPTLYADSPVEQHVEFNVALAKAESMRVTALNAQRAMRMDEALAAVGAAVNFMGTIEAHPTDFQLQLVFTHLMEHVPMKDIVARISGAHDQGESMRAVAARLQYLLEPSPSVVEGEEGGPPAPSVSARVSSVDAEALPFRGEARLHGQRKQLLLAVADVVMDKLEAEGTQWWVDTAASLAQDWRSYVADYERQFLEALDGRPLRTVTQKEAHALHLLARYAMALAPRSGMRPPGQEFAEGTLGDPLYCLRLLLGSPNVKRNSPHSKRAPETDVRIISLIVRLGRAASDRQIIAPIIVLLRLLAPTTRRRAYNPPPITLRTAVFITGCVRTAEDVPRIVPLLEKIAVKPDYKLACEVDTAGWKAREELKLGHLIVERAGPHATLARAMFLARIADAEGMRADDDEVVDGAGVEQQQEQEADKTEIAVRRGRIKRRDTEGRRDRKEKELKEQETREHAQRKKSLEERLLATYESWGLPSLGRDGTTDGSALTKRTARPKRNVKPRWNRGVRVN